MDKLSGTCFSFIMCLSVISKLCSFLLYKYGYFVFVI